MKAFRSVLVLAAVLVVSSALVGCRDHMPHAFTLAGGDISRTHAKPAEGGYYTNWDPYAASLQVTPAKDVNPVQTQHMLVATVLDKDGKPLPNRRVEWIISEGSVGDIVEVDESGVRNSRGHKVTNKYAISHSNNYEHVLDMGNDDPADDVHLTRGQTWCVITSPVEGTTHVVAYAPGIYDRSKHKVFVEKHWFDVKWDLPRDATNPVGTEHKLATKVARHSDGAPLAGYVVNYRIVGGPDAVLAPGDKTTASVTTDAEGMAVATLKQAKPIEGANDVEIDVIRPENKQCCKPAAHIASGKMKKIWVGPKIAIDKTAPATAVAGSEFLYGITVSNPSAVAAPDVVVTDTLPAGIAYVASTPAAQVKGQDLSWSLGTLAGQESKAISVTVKAAKTGKFTNCAAVQAAYGLSARDCADTIVAEPKLAIEKTGPAEVLLCEPIPYTIVVSNPGDAAATNVKIVDKLPAGLTWKGRDTVAADFGTLAGGASKKVQFAATASKAGTFENKADATADGGLKASSAIVKTVVRQPVLQITKKAPAMRFIGRPIPYEITVTNTGDGPARNTIVTDTLPAGAAFVDATEGGRMAGGKVVWNLGTLEPKASKKLGLTLRATTAMTVKNVVDATATCTKATAEATTEIKGIPAILLECIDLEDPIEVGSNETYLIKVTNQGSSVGTNIVVTVTLPAEEEFVSATGPTKETVAGKKVTFAPLASLAAKGVATYRVTVKALKAGDVRFRVSLKSDQMDTPAEESESTHLYGD